MGLKLWLCVQKFYKTMSEIKPEVEYVIKTGRQVVEKKQVDFPDKLNAQLDAMKQQYNELGAQVSWMMVLPVLADAVLMQQHSYRTVSSVSTFTQSYNSLSLHSKYHNENFKIQGMNLFHS